MRREERGMYQKEEEGGYVLCINSHFSIFHILLYLALGLSLSRVHDGIISKSTAAADGWI